ncbi:hypothetical protein C3486_13930 [Streptomyces sp. Ru73]|uniref:hypothetical protein n=1 Tax=Streptomyces sp. Ru73 TaxID=2080748 RepID=UPI000CDD1959|nr:hypothetical protein [Streptomyces sp. Ru73]POX40436.1 hypothetical protein C3486_13930 [Streptomyces sp. Ru73]
MYYYELQHRVRHEELRREADLDRLAREAAAGRRAARSAEHGTEGRVSRKRGRSLRTRRRAAA